MFRRRDRLPKDAFRARGRRASSAHFAAFRPEGSRGYAVVVSKKTARLSVERHRLKRRTLAALRALTTLPGALVVYPRASAGRLSPAQMRAELAALVSRVGI